MDYNDVAAKTRKKRIRSFVYVPFAPFRCARKAWLIVRTQWGAPCNCSLNMKRPARRQRQR